MFEALCLPKEISWNYLYGWDTIRDGCSVSTNFITAGQILVLAINEFLIEKSCQNQLSVSCVLTFTQANFIRDVRGPRPIWHVSHIVLDLIDLSFFYTPVSHKMFGTVPSSEIVHISKNY